MHLAGRRRRRDSQATDAVARCVLRVLSRDLNAVLLAHQVLDVAVVLLANELVDFFVGGEVGDALLGPRLSEHARIVHRDLDLQMAHDRAGDSVSMICSLSECGCDAISSQTRGSNATRSTTNVSPSQRRDGIAIPGGIGVGGMAAAVEINLVEAGAFVIGDVDQNVLALDELP